MLTEKEIHKTIIQWVSLYPKIRRLVMHFANEGKRSVGYGKLLKDLGLRPGVSDLFIAMARHGYHGAWIELKTPIGTLTKVQQEFLDDMKEQGYFTAVCRSIEDAMKVIFWYCFEDS